MKPIEHGQCIAHGYVDERRCSLFEPRRAKPFLAAALGGEKARQRALRKIIRETLREHLGALDRLRDE